jgi:hypothetical protein
VPEHDGTGRGLAAVASFPGVEGRKEKKIRLGFPAQVEIADVSTSQLEFAPNRARICSQYISTLFLLYPIITSDFPNAESFRGYYPGYRDSMRASFVL